MTPIKAEVLNDLLIKTGYNDEKRIKLVNSFRFSFDLRYRGPTKRKNTSENLPLQVGTLQDIWDKIMKEVSLGRCAGPYTKIPYPNYVQSPIGLVPKSENKTRLIFHLSYNFKDGQKSINYHTPKELCTVKYKDLDHAIETCLCMKNLCDSNFNGLCYSKTDIVSAFRLCPLKPSQRFLLILKATHPITKKTYYFVEKCMSFGASISCAHFQSFSDALAFIMERQSGMIWITVTNYLDDFLFIAYLIEMCNAMMQEFLELCKQLGCPTSPEKRVWASPRTIFLGMLLDGNNMTVSVPAEKTTKALNLIEWTLSKNKATIKWIQRLTGLLNFLNRAIVPGRTVTQSMYDKLRMWDAQGIMLKQHHHIHLDKQFKLDCLIWKQFLKNAQALQLCRKFVDWHRTGCVTAEQLTFYTDASKNPNLGMGGIFGDSWFFAQWDPLFIESQSPSIG